MVGGFALEKLNKPTAFTSAQLQDRTWTLQSDCPQVAHSTLNFVYRAVTTTVLQHTFELCFMDLNTPN